MTSQRTDAPGSKPRQSIPAPTGSSDRRRVLEAMPRAEDILAGSVPPTDDTPTIISRNSPVGQPTPEIDTSGVRGRILAHFELIEPIGVGGMAAVLRARDSQLDRFVALKILPPDMATDPENIRRFHQEARSAAKLDHENIARVFYCGEDQRLHFIAFEFVEGENLRNVIEKCGRLSPARAIHYMIQIAAGLSHASARGVVHRDIKPSNIIITPTGRAKLVDMGLARSMERQVDNELTQSGVTLGTFDYISPEQALEPRDADVRSDIYSLGCTFYHALTGRTPMPEGNPAKKLHYQQNHKPIDPRELAPDLPVEVVQILDRMMAKNPRDRFQTPEELVHRLLMAAKQLGINPDVPEGVLTVEASMPAPPAGRPLLWIAAAAVAVVALVLALDPLSNGTAPITSPVPSGQPNGDNGPPVKDAGPQAKQAEPAPPVRPDNNPEEDVYVAGKGATAEDLAGWLARRGDSDRIELHLAGELDLSARNGKPVLALLLAARKEVVIRPRDKGSRVTIRLAYPDLTNTPPVALTVSAPESRIEGVTFLIDGQLTPDTTITALRLKGGSHFLKACEFVQVRTVQSSASLVAESGRFSRSEVTLSDCSFLGFGEMKQEKSQSSESVPVGSDRGGQDAVVRKGAVKLTADNCVFGPHAAAFRLEGDGGDSSVVVKRCSVLLPAHRSAVFDLAEKATAKLDVQQSLVSRLDLPAGGEGGVLIRQSDDRADAVVYHGKDNGYHDLDGYWAVGDSWRAAGWGAFRQRNGSGQDSSRIVLTRPWLNEPAEVVRLLDQQKVRQAIQLDLTAAALRKQGRSATETIGVASVLGEELVRGELPALSDKAQAGAKRFLVVEEKTEDGPNGVYPGLHQAAAAAQPGDTILIRHDGELEVEPIVLNRKTQSDVTIRPARRFRPVLTLGEATENDSALFRVQDGKLRLDGLEFRLRPTRSGFKLVTAVTLAGDGLCEMRGCVATLEKSGDTAVALASLASRPDKEMKLDMPPARTREAGPKLLLVSTFIRGEGDLLWAKAIRPCELDSRGTVVALSGSLFSLDVAGDSKSPSVTQSVVLNLKQTTTYLGGHLVKMAVSKDPRGLVPVKAKAEKCLFVSSSSRALIQLDGAETEEKSLKEKFSWEGGPNAYGGYTSMQAQNPGGEEMAPPPLNPEKWKMLQSGEGDSAFSVKLNVPSDSRYPQLSPTLFARPREAGECGADVTAKGFPRPR